MKTGTLIVLVLATLFAGVLHAQDYRGRVVGTVSDSTGAVIGGATIHLRNVNTGVETVRQAGANGQYVFDFVEPGTYELTAEVPGFSRFIQQNILVQVRSDISVNPVLNPGAVVETVNVSSQTVEVQFNTSTMALTVDRKMLTDLPVLARNPFTLALLDPAGFARKQPDHGRNWHLRLEQGQLTALAAFPGDVVLRFGSEQFGLPPIG